MYHGINEFRAVPLPDTREKPSEQTFKCQYFVFTDKSVLLFVVNHPTQVIGDSQVDIFRFVEEENAIVHLKTIRHDLLHRYVKSLMAHNREVFCFCLTKYFVSPSFFLSFSVNDIVAVGPESFYATNDHSFPNELLHMLTVILGLPWCNVIYYSPQEVKVVRDGFLSANGINISPDKRFLFVLVNILLDVTCFIFCKCIQLLPNSVQKQNVYAYLF